MKVSIITPIYGVEKYIERCARSLFEQTYENIEYVFVNDCTKDNSIDILKSIINEYPERMPYVNIVEHENNRGLAAARNTGVDNSHGDYLMHVDSDDWLVNNAVEILVAKAVIDKPDVILFGSKNIYKDKEIINFVPKLSKVQYIKNVMIHSIGASIWNKFYRAEFYKKSGVRSIEGIDNGEDYVFVPRLLYNASCLDTLDMPLYNYNLTNVGSYTNNISTKSIKSLFAAASELDYYFTNIPDAKIYESCTSIIYLKTMFALVKLAPLNSYSEIFREYSKCPPKGYNSLSVQEKLLYLLLKTKLYSAVNGLIRIYRRIKS